MKNNFLLFLVFFVVTLLSSCSDDKMSNYYDIPSELNEGSIYEVLEKKGNYSIFLKAVDLSGFKEMVDGKSVLTVMAPDDSSFSVYLNNRYGTNNIENLPVPEIKKVVGFHIMYYSFDKDKLINYRPNEGDGATADEKLVNAGMYYKHRTKSKDPVSLEYDPTFGAEVHVYHQERFLPVFSYRMFQTKKIDAQYNYEYFFPNTPWKGADGFNVSNAAVDDYSVVADNGYVYMIDRVLKPLETIYTELASDTATFSEYLSLFNKYEYYFFDEDLTREEGNGTDLYDHYYKEPMPNIASEWPVSDYTKEAILSYSAYSVFAPTNKALQGFFNDYWKIGGYDSLMEVSQTSIEYLLFNSVYGSSVVFPEEITKGEIENNIGTVIKFDVDQVPDSNRIMCANGALYGLTTLTPPAMFGSVTGPAFQYKKFGFFLDMLNASDMILTLCSDNANYILLYPSDTIMKGYGITSKYDKVTQEYVIYQGTERMSNSTKQNYVYAHVASGDEQIESFAGGLPDGGTHVFRTIAPGMYLYWYMKDGKITNSIKYNELLYSNMTEDSVFCNIERLEFRGGDWSNGICYTYDNDKLNYVLEGSSENARYSEFVSMMIGQRTVQSKPFYGFIQLLNKAGMVDMDERIITAMLENCLVLVPTTSAVESAISSGRINGISVGDSVSVGDSAFFDNCTVDNADTLQYYLRKYFIPLSTAVMSNYPYLGWGEDPDTKLITMQSKDAVDDKGNLVTYNTTMNIIDDGSKLSVQEYDFDGNAVGSPIDFNGEFHYFPFIFDDACVQFINGMF